MSGLGISIYEAIGPVNKGACVYWNQKDATLQRYPWEGRWFNGKGMLSVIGREYNREGVEPENNESLTSTKYNILISPQHQLGVMLVPWNITKGETLQY